MARDPAANAEPAGTVSAIRSAPSPSTTATGRKRFTDPLLSDRRNRAPRRQIGVGPHAQRPRRYVAGPLPRARARRDRGMRLVPSSSWLRRALLSLDAGAGYSAIAACAP